MKTRRVLSILVIVVMMFLLVGCNYITRPVGVANNATENGDLLANLRVLPANDNQNTDNDNSNNDSQNNDEPNNNLPNNDGPSAAPSEDKLTGTFNVAGDVLKKIEQIIANVKSSDKNFFANSSKSTIFSSLYFKSNQLPKSNFNNSL